MDERGRVCDGIADITQDEVGDNGGIERADRVDEGLFG